MIDLIAADSPDHGAVEAQLAEIRSEVESMQEAVVRHLLDDKQILDARQQERFFEVLKARIRSQGTPAPPWIPREVYRRREY